jgi:hypothetical protein
MMRQPGSAGSNTAADHLAVIREALRQLPCDASDSAGAPDEVADWLTARHLSYSLGFTLADDTVARIEALPAHRSATPDPHRPADSSST